MITNAYIAKVKPSAHSLIIPLGACGTLNIKDNRLKLVTFSTKILRLTDISGAIWQQNIVLK